MSYSDMDKWMEYKGKEFLQDIGLKREHIVLDFGCRHGTYTIPASLVVNKKGIVYAVDKNKDSLKRLIIKAKEKELKNIKILDSTEKTKILLPNESVDFVLLYDVLHLIENREQLLLEIYRILKPGGILSLYPKHYQTHMNVNLAELMQEVESVGFNFDAKFLKSLMHDDKIEEGYVFNFRKI
jgi:ubiquinone/menaquinone biosynthesis C-methylase UbiE